MMRRFAVSDPDFNRSFRAFLNLRRSRETSDLFATASSIVSRVREEGATAVADLTQRYDTLTLDCESLQSPEVDLHAAAKLCAPEVRQALDFAARRIEAYHSAQKPGDSEFSDGQGNTLGWRWSAIASIGLYVPGGRASYPSSVLMNAIPARVAGCRRLVMTSPCPGGAINPAVAYAALRSGVDEFYPIGGAQAIAALAYGAGPMHPVDKIVGPGNAYVAAAKRIVFGDVGIDTIAGPSEITVIADRSCDPRWIAADLLSQAEHDPLAQSILLTPDADFAADVEREAEAMLPDLGATAQSSWRDYGAIVLCELGDAADVTDMIAPEHVEIATGEPEALAARIRNAGAIFIGRYAPEALGDYVTGSNHVLPTSGAARFSSGLSVLDFMKRTSVQKISAEGFRHLAEAAETLARAEGLPAHALSVSVRREHG
jgi:histidinol dehydrogenase